MTTHTQAVAASYDATVDRDALNAECLQCTISGRPLPAGLQARVAASPLPPTVAAGIEWILRGGA